MKKNYISKLTIVTIAALFGFATAFAQDEPKTVKFNELLTPVIGENGAEPFEYVFQAAAAWGDYNNDGYLDLLSSGVYVSLRVDEEGNPVLNEEGNQIQDWIKSTKLYKNNGDGTFTKIDHPFPHFDVGGISWLDYNNDGNLDVFIAGNTDAGRYSGLWQNLGQEGNFEFEAAFSDEFAYFKTNSNNNPSRIIAVADYNNDGLVDIAVQGSSDYGRITYLYRNLGGDTGFMLVNPVDDDKPFVQMNGGTLHWGDFNNDGYLDLLAFGFIQNDDTFRENYDYSLFYDLRPNCNDGTCISGAGILYINNGDGTFAMPTADYIFPFGEDGTADWGDYNNDGYLDFYATGFAWWKDIDWNIGLHENKKDGTFQRHPIEETGLAQTQGSTHAWGDVNNDGFEDIVVNNAHPSAIFLNNAGSMAFTRFNIPFATDEGAEETLDIRGGTITLVDFDNDGDLDVFTNGYDDRNVRTHLLQNNLDSDEGIPVNQAPSVPANLQAITEDDVTTFTWDASTDDLTPSVALRYNLYVKQDNVIMMVLPADLTTGRLKVNETLAPITRTTYQITGLEGDFQWGVQAIDNAKNASAFAKVDPVGIKQTAPLSVTVTSDHKAIRIRTNANVSGTVNVYAVSGQNIYTQSGKINNTSIELPSGVYIVKTVSEEGTSINKVVVK